MNAFKPLLFILPALAGATLLAEPASVKGDFSPRSVQASQMRVPDAQELSPALVQELRSMPKMRSMTQVEAYLESQPESEDSAFLLFTAGRGLYQAGSYSRALDVLERAWAKASASEAEDWKEEKLVARIAADLGGLYARLGRLEELETLLAEMEGRPIGGAQTLAFDNLRQAVDSMQNRPEVSFRCGPAALETLFKAENPDSQIPATLRSATSTREGVSVATLESLSAGANMPYRAVRADPLNPPVPSVVHWKAGHYAAIVEQTSEGYVVEDPTFMRKFVMTAEALAEESSGVFLVPVAKVKPEQAAIPAAEKAEIRGRGAPSQSDSENQGGSGDEKCPTGLPEYSFNDFYAALVIKDSPLFYAPPYGPEVAVQLYYFDAGNFDNTTSEAGHTGRKWFLGWSRYLENTATGSATPIIRMAKTDGRTEVCPPADVNNPTELSSTLSRTKIGIINNAQNQLTSLTKNLPDGSVETYGHKHEVLGETDKFYITSLTDPHGNSLTFEYVTGTAKLKRVLDALGRATTVHYSDSVDGVGADNPSRFTISAIKDPFGRTVRFHYDGSDCLTRLVDVEGNETIFRYTDSTYTDFITEMETPYGVSLFEKTSTTAEKELLITDPVGNQERLRFRFTYQGEPLLGVSGTSAVTDETPLNLGFDIANGQGFYGYLYYGTTLHWDKKAMATLKKDPALSEYAAAHQTRWLQAGDNYNILTGTPSSTRPALSHREWYRYPDQINAGTFGSFDQPTTTVRRIKDENDAWANEITYAAYNSLGHPTSYTDALGREIIFNYAANEIDLLTVQRRANGSPLETLVTYSGYGGANAPHRPTSIVDGAGQTTTLEWTTEGLIRRVTDPNLHVTRYDYDSSGYLEAIYRSAPNTPIGSAGTLVELASFDYDSKDRVNKMTLSDGYDLDFEFDDLNRLVKTTYPDGTTEETGYFAVTADKFTDRLGRVTWSELDGNGQPLMVIDPAGRIAQYRWCACGALRSYTDAEGRTTQWKRDLEWRVTDKIYPDESKDSFTFEPASGRLATLTRAKDQDGSSPTQSYRYFLDGQMASMDYTDAATADISYTYHPIHGRMLTASQAATGGAKVTTFAYNPVDGSTLGADQLNTVDGALADDTLRYLYDALGRATGVDILNNSGGVIASQSVAFDALERIKSSTTPLGTFTNVFDGLTERITSTTHSNGIAREFDYHNLLGDKRLQKITNRTGNAASDIVSTFDYSYNAVGNIKEWGVRNDQGARNAWTLDYNPADELTDALLKSPTSAVIEDLGWRFDRAGNRRLARDGSTWTGYGVNDVNELTEISDGDAHAPISGQLDEPAIVTVQGVRANVKPVGGNYQFEAPLNVEPDSNGEFTVRAEDASGNVVESTFAAPAASFGTPRMFLYDDNGNLKNDGIRTYFYDAANRLIGIDHADGSTTDIEYDAFSRRDRIIEKDATATVTSDKRYIWNGLTLLEERDTATDTVLRRFYGTGEEWLTGIDAGNYFYFRDHLGSVRELIDSTGATRARYNYSLWGERTQLSGNLNTEFGYTGHWYHETSGLHLAPFRAYDSELGRWLNRDPIEGFYQLIAELLAEGPNLYSYVSNNPVSLKDPLGLQVLHPASRDSVSMSFWREMGRGNFKAARQILDDIGGAMNPGRRRAFKEGLKQCERHSKELKRLSKASRKRLKEELKNRKKELERHLKKRDGEHTPETIRMNQQIEYIENLLP